MYHTITFRKDLVVLLQTSPRRPAEQRPIPKGSCRQARVRPYVADTDDGLVEMADLFFEDGTLTREVPFACFAFHD